ncbi:hypothetical protein BH23CHL2_BH23CHL2_27350 [soil metagenome]
MTAVTVIPGCRTAWSGRRGCCAHRESVVQMELRSILNNFITGVPAGDGAISRRRLLRRLAGVAASIPVAALLAACGDDKDDDGSAADEPTATAASNSSSEAEPTATEESSGDESSDGNSSETRTIEHAYGTAEIPAHPERVVTLDYFALETLIALGVTPIGASLNGTPDAQHEYIRDQLEGITPVGESLGEPDLEKIAQLEPDLILGLDLFFEERRDILEQIAPIAVFPFESSAQWKEIFRFYADAAGLADEAEAVITEYEDRVEELRQTVGPDTLADLEVSVVRVNVDDLRIYNLPTFIGVILEDVGLGRPEAQRIDEFSTTISREQIREADADVLFLWGGAFGQEEQNKQLEDLADDPVFGQLEAVQNGRAYFVDGDTWIGSCILAAHSVLDDLFEIFADIRPTDSADATFPVTIEHKYGETTIPGEPQRIIALGYNEQDAILALGVKPIAVRYWFGDEPFAVFPWAQDELGDAEPEVLEMTFGELDFEAIAALEPDLISAVYAGITEQEYETLSRIAPTVAQSGDYIDFGMPWDEMTISVGRALGKESEAQELVAEVKAQFEAAREAHPEWGGKEVVVGAPRGDGEFGFVASEDARSRVFTSLGFVVPEEFDEIAGDQFWGTISLERADLLDHDLLVFHQMAWVEGGREAIGADPLLSQLDVMKEGRVLYVEGTLDDALQFGTVLSLSFLLDNVVPMLEAVMDGDPETEATP